MEEVQSQLNTLIKEGETISIKIQQQMGQMAFLSFGRLAAYFMLDDDNWDALQDLEDYVRRLKLPGPIQDIYLSYISWNRKSDSLFHRLQWLRDKRILDFGSLRKDFGREISKKEPRLELLNAKVVEQVAILKSLIEQPPKVVQKQKSEKVKVKKDWRTRKVIYAIVYLVSCLAVDVLLFPLLAWGILGVVSIEIAVFLGLPKLAEWLKT
jgi:hypothetical protein